MLCLGCCAFGVVVVLCLFCLFVCGCVMARSVVVVIVILGAFVDVVYVF